MKHIRNLIITAVTLLFVVLIAYLSRESDGNYIFTIPLLVFLVCVIILIQWVMFLPSYLKSTEHYFDITGSITFITVSILAFILSDNKNIRSILLTLLIIVWATRLGIFLLKRVKAAGSDGRFDDLKDFSTFFMVWNLQALWITFTLLSSLIIFTSNHSGNLEIYDYIGIITWISGLFIEVVADKQKSDFKNDISNKNKFISTGLWKYSRHPNYLGEIILWTGITIIAIPLFSGWSWLGLISPVFVFIMLKFISGVRILENRADMKWGKDKEYLKYKNSTPEIFPFKIG